MALFSSTYLRSVSRLITEQQRTKLFSESREQSTFDIFLSHSFLDKDEVGGLYFELTRRGFSVYVDWIVDPHLSRGNVTKETAELIRNRMKQSKSLLLAMSDNAQLSKWIPWELGFVDGKTARCALVPVSQNIGTATTFDRQEYLKLYPYIKQAPDINNRLWVVEAAHEYESIESWLNTGELKYQSRNINVL